jgi:hypothetical protein
MSLNREFLIWKEKGIGVREREREREKERERWAGGSAGRIFKVRFGRDREIERRTRQRYRETNIQS